MTHGWYEPLVLNTILHRYFGWCSNPATKWSRNIPLLGRITYPPLHSGRFKLMIFLVQRWGMVFVSLGGYCQCRPNSAHFSAIIAGTSKETDREISKITKGPNLSNIFQVVWMVATFFWGVEKMVFVVPRHPNTYWPGVWSIILGSKHLTRYLDV